MFREMRAIMSSVFVLLCMHSLQASYDVIIIGGGMSGLSALNHLYNNGITNVALFEGKSRFGGRIHSVKTQYGHIDLGAQWIHGASVLNSAFNLANSNDLLNELKCDNKPKYFISSNRTSLTEEQKETILRPLEALFDGIPAEVMLEEYLNSKFEENLPSFPKYLHNLAREVFTALKVFLCFHRGNDLELLTNDNMFRPLACDVDFPGGMSQLVDALLKKDELKRKTHLRTEVTGLTLSKSGEISVSVLQDGKRMPNQVAKYVIFTPSIGVLKHLASGSYFKPALPAKKLDALSRLGLGRGVKIFLQYKEPFWKQGDFGPLLLGVNDKKYHDKDWESRAAFFSELPDVNNTLMTVVIGEASLEVDQLDLKIVGRKLTRKLRKYTGDYSIPLPTQVIRSEWNQDKFIRGTWTSTYAGFTPKDITVLIEPHMNGRLRFAGESTAGPFFTTIHGARNSGLREAQNVLEQLSGRPYDEIDDFNVI